MSEQRHACVECFHLRHESEDVYGPHWWECSEHPAWDRLKSFPFKSTKCPDFLELPNEAYWDAEMKRINTEPTRSET